MGKDSAIEWCHHTFNPWSGCEKVSAGCANCYAAALPPGMRRHAEWGKDRPRVVASESYWRQPLAWDRAAAKAGERHRVFCASTADVFEAREDLDGARSRLFNAIDATPHLDWLLLTKRPEYAVEWWGRESIGGRFAWPANAWVGTSVEDQAAADARIPHLLKLPARVRFLSMEPLLGAVDLTRVADFAGCGESGCTLMVNALTGTDHCDHGYWAGPPRAWSGALQWVIVGGESGRHARPMHPDWARSLRDQCDAAGVPFFFKQWGAWVTERQSPEDIVLPGTSFVRWGDSDPAVYHVGKHAAGRLLDGREWNEVPCV